MCQVCNELKNKKPELMPKRYLYAVRNFPFLDPVDKWLYHHIKPIHRIYFKIMKHFYLIKISN